MIRRFMQHGVRVLPNSGSSGQEIDRFIQKTTGHYGAGRAATGAQCEGGNSRTNAKTQQPTGRLALSLRSALRARDRVFSL
jgi:hypothetical protein